MKRTDVYGASTDMISRRGFLGGLAASAGALAFGKEVFAQEVDERTRVAANATKIWNDLLASYKPKGEVGARLDLVAVEFGGREPDLRIPVFAYAPGESLGRIVVEATVRHSHGDGAAYPVGFVFGDIEGRAVLRHGEQRKKTEEGRSYVALPELGIKAPVQEGWHVFWMVGAPQATVQVEGGGKSTKYDGHEFTSSMTAWTYGRTVRGDGNDIKDWKKEQVLQALAEGYVIADQLSQDGKTERGTVAARPIILAVSKTLEKRVGDVR